jgi:hypothetical protein
MSGISCNGGSPVDWSPAAGAVPGLGDGLASALFSKDEAMPQAASFGKDRYRGEVYGTGPEFDKMINLYDKMSRHTQE